MITTNIDRLLRNRSNMARPLNVLDILVIAGLIILAGFLIYLLQPIVIAVAIIAAAYFIYRWYTGRRVMKMA